MNLTKNGIEAFFLAAVLFAGFALSFLISDFGAQGGANTYNLIVCALFAFAFLYLTIRKTEAREEAGRAEAHVKNPSGVKFPTTLLWLLGLFSVTLLVTDFTGWYLHASLIDTLEWFLAFSLFFGTAAWTFRAPGNAHKFAGYFVVGAALLSLYGFYTFTQALGYLHLGSVLNEHNGFGGFLLIPLCISYALALSSRFPRMRILYVSTSILIGSGLILTFSRGTWLAFLLALILGAVFFRKSLWQTSRKKFLRAGALILFTLLLSGGWYLFAQKLGTIEASSVSIYGGSAVPTDSTLDRLEYLVEASQIFEAHPLGIGLGNYNLGAQTYRTSVLHFAFDPHNIYVQIFVETGFIGGILFALSMLYLFFRPAYATYAQTQSEKAPELVLPLLIGIGAALIHVGMDVDLVYPVTVFALFISLGMLWGLSSGLLSLEIPSNAQTLSQARKSFGSSLSSSLPTIATCIAGIVVILFLFEFASTYYSLKGNDAISQKEYSTALSSYKTSATLDPTNAGAYLSEGQAYYYLASNATSSQNHAYMNDALTTVQKSIKLNPHSSIAYIDEAYTYQAIGNEQGAINAFENGVAVDPLNNLDDHVHLMQLYLFTRQNLKAIQVASKITTAFPPLLFSNPTWGDPNKMQWQDDLEQITAMEAGAYRVLGNTAGSNVATSLQKQYSDLKI